VEQQTLESADETPPKDAPDPEDGPEHDPEDAADAEAGDEVGEAPAKRKRARPGAVRK